MALWTEWVEANETGGNNFTQSEVVNLNGSYGIYASCALSKFNGNGGSPQAEIYISEYVQNGNPFQGSWNELLLNGVSSITVSLTVNNATAKGVMTITTDRLRARRQADPLPLTCSRFTACRMSAALGLVYSRVVSSKARPISSATVTKVG